MTTVAQAITAELVTITPELAEQLLARNSHNRGIREQRVQQYAADIRRGEWQINGEAIKIAADGQVLDGQHRLMAVLEADAPIQTLLITGLEVATQETMDQGRARTFSDVLKLRGEKYHIVIAGAVRMIYAYERNGIPMVESGWSPSVPDSSRVLDHNPELRDSCEFAQRVRRPWLPITTVAGMHYLLASADPQSAADFFTRLSSGASLDPTHPIYVLRERLIADRQAADGRRLAPKAKLAFIVIAWNAYLDGEPLTRLSWTAGGSHPDAFPAIRGLDWPNVRGGGSMNITAPARPVEMISTPPSVPPTWTCRECNTKLIEPTGLCGFCAPEDDD